MIGQHTEIEKLDSKLSPNQHAEMNWFREHLVLTAINADVNLGIKEQQLDKDMKELIAYGHPIYLIDLYRHPKIKTHKTKAYIYCGCGDVRKLVQSIENHTNWTKLNDAA